MHNIKITTGDITTAEVDAIVNAANPSLLGGGGVDGAIHRAAGPSLLEACKQIATVAGVRCPFGESRITAAGKLKARYVIHAVGPIYHQEQHPDKVLAAAYHGACQLALDHHCQSLAFPAISCGVYGYPHEQAAQIALAACSDERYREMNIVFYIFQQPLFETFTRTYRSLTDNQ